MNQILINQFRVPKLHGFGVMIKASLYIGTVLINSINGNSPISPIKWKKMGNWDLPYVRHYKPWLVYFFPIFHCGLYCRAVIITDNLCTKKENPKIRGL